MSTPFTSKSPECRRVLARLRLVRIIMRRERKLALQGRQVNLRSTDVQETWRANGWERS